MFQEVPAQNNERTQRAFASRGGDGVVCIWDYDESMESQ
jgi:hypothetical protein